MELAPAVAKVLDQAIAEPDELPQLLGRAVGQTGGGWALLGREAGDPQGVDGVGLCAPQVLAGEPARAEGVEQGDGEVLGHQGDEQVLPVMAGRLHGDQRAGGRPEQTQELLVPCGILGEGCRLEEHGVCLVDPGHDMPLGGHIDPHEAHSRPFRRGWSGASEPVLMLTLVHARTPAAPQDTVRVLSTGRGRQSHRRGLSLQHAAATLSRIPSALRYTRDAS